MARRETRGLSFVCEAASVYELETSPCLERNYGKSGYYGYYLERSVTMITNFGNIFPNNFFKTESEIDLSKVEYYTILDTPICAKINSNDAIIPGMLMTITCDGNNASLVFFPMSLCCSWSKDPSSPFYYDDSIYMFHLYGHNFIWKERPFTQIFSLYRKGKKMAFTRVRNRPSEYESEYIEDYVHIW